MGLDKKENETQFEYHKRLIYGKLEDKTLEDIDYAELAPLVYGKDLSSDTTRRMMYGSRDTLKLFDEELKDYIKDSSSEEVLRTIDSKLIELKKEKQKFFDQRTAFNKVVRERARQEEVNELLVEAIMNGDLPELNYEPRFIGHSDNDLLVSLNDIHYGLNVDNYWNTFNSDIVVEMFNTYLDKILEIRTRHTSERCIVWMNGDAISGNIHRTIALANKENVIQQVKGVSELIAQFLTVLSENFREVHFVSVAGNHSRITPNKQDALKDERLDDLIEWYLEARLMSNDRVTIGLDNLGSKIDQTMYVMDIRGKTYCGVHGDYDYSDRNVQALQSMVGKPLYAVLSGHLHHNSVDTVQGIKTVMAGSFVGMDDYCIEKRIFGHPEQMVCVCDETGILCHYNIDLS